jgi:hypothetical protein
MPLGCQIDHQRKKQSTKPIAAVSATATATVSTTAATTASAATSTIV